MIAPQFELPFSGWYWQITRLDVDHPEIRTSRSLFGAQLPRLEGAAKDDAQPAQRLRRSAPATSRCA